MKTCWNCSEEKPLSEFEHGRAQCNRCRIAYIRKWQKDHLSQLADQHRQRQRQVRYRYMQLKYLAKKRDGSETDIDMETYANLIESNACHYCWFALRDTGAGLDRKDASRGYTLDNVVPACWECNTAKRDAFTYEETLVIGQAIRQVKLARSKGSK